MKKIGVLFGMENTFPGALVEKINEKNLDGITAEFVEIGAIRLDRPPAWLVIVDRISHDIPSVSYTHLDVYKRQVEGGLRDLGVAVATILGDE